MTRALALSVTLVWAACDAAGPHESDRGRVEVEDVPEPAFDVEAEPAEIVVDPPVTDDSSGIATPDPAAECACGWGCDDAGCGCVACPTDTDGLCDCGVDCNGHDCWCKTCEP